MKKIEIAETVLFYGLLQIKRSICFSLHLSEGVAHIQGKTIVRDQHHR